MGSRDTSPTRHGFASHFGGSGKKSRNSSPTRNNRGRSGNGLSSIGLHALTPASAGHIDQNGSHRSHGYSTPRSLPDNVPWAVSYLPDRTGTSHATCNCGRTTEELTEAEQRLLEGVPTAPGAWVENTDANVPPPPWAPPSRASSPCRVGITVLDRRGKGFVLVESWPRSKRRLEVLRGISAFAALQH